MSRVLYDKIVEVGFFKTWYEDVEEHSYDLDALHNITYYSATNTVTGEVVKFESPSEGPEGEGFAITCPKMRLKPNIHVSLSVLPDNQYYGCTIKIINMNHLVDILSYKIMHVRIGYRYGTTDGIINDDARLVAEFRGPIFRSYQTTPNPDGETIFEGVIVGDVLDPFEGRPMKFTVHTVWEEIEDENGEKIKHQVAPITVHDFITLLADSRGGNITYHPPKTDDTSEDDTSEGSEKHKYTSGKVVYGSSYRENSEFVAEFSCDEEIENMIINISALSGKPIENFMQLIKRASDILKEQVTNVTGVPVSLMVLDKKLKFVAFQQGKLREGTHYVPIKFTYSASYSASILTVTAPYDPRITTGTLVKVSPNFFNGANITNEMDLNTDILGPAEGYIVTKEDVDGETTTNKESAGYFYTVLHMKIDFGTYDGNTMELLCLPIGLTGDKESSENTKSSVSNNEYIEHLKASVDEVEARELVYGTPSEAQNFQPDIFSTDIKLENYTLYEAGYMVKKGDTLSSIGKNIKQNFPGLSWVWHGGAYGDQDCTGYISSVGPEDSTERFRGVCHKFTENRDIDPAQIPASYLWPCIVAITRKYAEGNSTFASNCALDFRGTDVDVDSITAGGLLMLPLNYRAENLAEGNDPDLQSSVLTLEKDHKDLYLNCAKYAYSKMKNSKSNSYTAYDVSSLLNMFLFLGGKLTSDISQFFGGIQGWSNAS